MSALSAKRAIPWPRSLAAGGRRYRLSTVFVWSTLLLAGSVAAEEPKLKQVLNDHLSKQAANGYAHTLAESAGKDSSVEKQTQADIAGLTRDFTPSEKAEVIERSRQQYAKGMKNELIRTLDPETASKIAADKADDYARGLAAEMRGQGGATGSGDASRAPRGPGDVAVFGPNAKVAPIDNRETPRGQGDGLDEGDVIGIAQAAYKTGEKLGDAALATLKQKEALSKRAAALDKGDLDAALRHQRQAAKYGEQARESMGDAVVEGLNGVPLDKVGGLQGNDKAKAAVSLGDYAKSAYETGKNYGEASLSLYKAGNYQEQAAQAETRGETRVADQYRRLAADAQLKGVERGIDGIRETPIIGGAFKLGEARVLHNQAAQFRARAGEALKRGDLSVAQQLNAQAAQLDEQKQADIKGALDNIPLLGDTAKKYGELGADYGEIQKKLGDSREYMHKATVARERGETRLATKYDALAAKSRTEAYESLTETVESTPVAGTMQELSRALIALKHANREREMAASARKVGDDAAARLHENRALVQEKAAGDNFDTFKEQAPTELAAILAAASSYGPHAVMLTAMYKGTRHTLENTEQGKRLEEAKTEGLAGLIESAHEAWKKLSGGKTTREQQDEDVVRLQQAWQRKLDSGEIQLKPDVSHDDFMSAIALTKSANRKAASLSDLGLLDAYVEVSDKSAHSGESPADSGKSGGGWGEAPGGFSVEHGAEAGWGDGGFEDDRQAGDEKIERIIALSNGCAYQDAYRLAQQLKAEDPDNNWINANYSAIGEWAEREKIYHQAIGSAHRAVQTSDLEGAITDLRRAMANAATQCRQDQVVRQILDQALALAGDAGRQAAIDRAKRDWQRSTSSRSSGYSTPAPVPSTGQSGNDNAGLINSLTNLMQSINRAGNSSGNTGTNVDDIYRNLNTQQWDDAAGQESADPSAFLPKGYQPQPGTSPPALPPTQRSIPVASPGGPGTGEFSIDPDVNNAPAASGPQLWNCNAGGHGCRYDDGWHDNSGRVFATEEEMRRANGW